MMGFLFMGLHGSFTLRGIAMPLKPQPAGFIPEETARVARAAFPQGNLYLRIRVN